MLSRTNQQDVMFITIRHDDVEHCKYPATIKRIVNRLVELVSKTQSSVIKAILVETAINMIDNIDIYSDCNISMFDIIKLDSTYITIPAGNTKDKSIYLSVTIQEDESDVFEFEYVAQAAVFKYPSELLDCQITISGWQSADYTPVQTGCIFGDTRMEYNPTVLVDAINKYGQHVIAHEDIKIKSGYYTKKRDTNLRILFLGISKKVESKFNMNLLMLIMSQYLSANVDFSIDGTAMSIYDTSLDITLIIRLKSELNSNLASIDEIVCFNNKYKNISMLIEYLNLQVPENVLDRVRSIIPMIPVNISPEYKYNVTELSFILSNVMKLLTFTALYQDSFSTIENMPKPDIAAIAGLIKMKDAHF